MDDGDCSDDNIKPNNKKKNIRTYLLPIWQQACSFILK